VNSLMIGDVNPARDTDPGDTYPFRRDLVLEFGERAQPGLVARARDLTTRLEREPTPDRDSPSRWSAISSSAARCTRSWPS
jgi:hypothetical protein